MSASQNEQTGEPLGADTGPDAQRGGGATASPMFDSAPARRYPGNSLARHHEERLAAALILPAVAEARGYRTMAEKTALARYHFAPYQRRVPGILIPIYPAVGSSDRTAFEFAQFRPDSPRVGRGGKPVKYETAAGGRNALDCLPSMRRFLADPKIPLMITEGNIKSDALTSAALREGTWESPSVLCLSIQGVWGWRGRNPEDGLTALADWDAIALNHDRLVLLTFDSDVMVKPGVHAALVRLKTYLEAKGATVTVVYLPDGPNGEKQGADDYLAAGHSLADLLALAEPELREPPKQVSEAASGASPSTTTQQAVSGEDESPILPLAALLSEVLAFLTRFVAFASRHQAVAEAMWIPHAHAIDAADTTLYLAITSPDKRSGKTRNLEELELLVPRPWRAIRPSEAVVFRKIATDQPTFLLDEVDAIFKDKAGAHEGLRAMLNAGHRRDATVPRCVGEGTAIHVEQFPVFCAKAIAGIGDLPDTVADRSIPIRLVRRAPGERVERFRRRDVERDAVPIRNGLARWARGHVEVLKAARPDIPGSLGDRAADGWEPLLAIADLAGGDWPRLAREAAVALHGDPLATQESVGVTLLQAIRDLFEETGASKMPSADLLCALIERDAEPWAELWAKAVLAGETRGPGYRLARLLRPYGIVSKTIRTDDGKTPKGYDLADFEDAFSRWLPSPPPKGRNDDTALEGQGVRSDPTTPRKSDDATRSAVSDMPSGVVASFQGQEAAARDGDGTLPLGSGNGIDGCAGAGATPRGHERDPVPEALASFVRLEDGREVVEI